MKNKKFLKIGLTSTVALTTLCFCVLVVPSFFNKDVTNSPIAALSAESQSLDRGSENNAAINLNHNTIIPQKPIIQNSPLQNNTMSQSYPAYNEEDTQNTGILFDDQADDFSVIPNSNTYFANGITTAEGQTLYYKFDSEKGDLFIRNDKKTDYISFDSANLPPWFSDENIRFKIKTVTIENEVMPTSTKAWFGCIAEMKKGLIPMMNIYKFEGLDNINMENVTEASYMFLGCNRAVVYNGCLKNMNNVKNAFAICNSTAFKDDLLNDIASQILESAIDLRWSFSNNPYLTSIKQLNNTKSSCTMADYMFYNCTHLETIWAVDLLSSDSTETRSIEAVFAGCLLLKEIILCEAEWKSPSFKIPTRLFDGCYSLIGEKGTTYSGDGLNFAKTDKGKEGAGYFTLRPKASINTTPSPLDKTPIYNGQDQEIAQKGTASNGVMKYYVTTDNVKPTDKSLFEDTPQKASNAGMYYLWYYIKATTIGYDDLEIIESAIECTIDKADYNGDIYFNPLVVSYSTYSSEDKTSEDISKDFNAAIVTEGTVYYSVTDRDKDISEYFKINDGQDQTVNKLTCCSGAPVKNYQLTLSAKHHIDNNHLDKIISINTVIWTVENPGSYKPLTINGIRYLPVFSGENGIEGVEFYKQIENDSYEKIDVTTMASTNDATHYKIIEGSEGTSFKAVRSINEITYNSVYGDDKKFYKHNVLTIWANNNLKDGECVEPLSILNEPSEVPQIGTEKNKVRLTDIWNAYKTDSNGFGGSFGPFWSCVAADVVNA